MQRSQKPGGQLPLAGPLATLTTPQLTMLERGQNTKEHAHQL